MERRDIPWKAEWKAAGLEPGPLTPEEEALVPGLEAENREFLERHPYRPGRPPLRISRAAVWALPAAAAAALLVVLAGPVVSGGQAAPVLERAKGGVETHLTVYRQGKSGPEKLAARAVVRPGDVLQAAYSVAKPAQGALLSVDGAGNVTVHLAEGGRSVLLQAGAEHPLTFSYELDQAPRFEVFFLLVSDKPFDLEPVRQLLKTRSWDSLAAGAFGPGIDFTVLPLTKEGRP